MRVIFNAKWHQIFSAKWRPQAARNAHQAIHAMHNHGVAGASETHQRFQLRALNILARGEGASTWTPSSCRSRFCSKMLTRMYPICCSFMACYCAPTSIFSIKRIIVSFCAAADSATSSANAASPMSLMTGCPSRISALLRFKKSTNRKAPVRLLPSASGWFLMTKYNKCAALRSMV